jgi:hypothetical protein
MRTFGSRMYSRRFFAICRPILSPSPVLGFLASLAALILTAPAAMAAWPYSPYIDFVVSAAASEQSAAAIVSDGAGGAIVAWQDYRGGMGADIYAQRILATGVPPRFFMNSPG